MNLNEDLYHRTNVPLPSTPLLISDSDSLETVCRKIDNFFEDLIREYPDETQSLLRSMYYDDCNVVPVRSIEQGSQASWNLSAGEDGIEYKMVLDERLFDTPILAKWNKIHEIAGHIGQVSHRIDMVGLDQWLEEVNNNSFRKFTELSIAPAEKALLDAIPETVIEGELKRLDKSIQSTMRHDIHIRREMDYDQYVRLRHRSDQCSLSASITEDEYRFFHSRPDVNSFAVQMRTDTIELPQSPYKQRFEVLGNDSPALEI